MEEEILKLRAKYPNRVPVLVRSRDARLELKKRKYLVPRDLTVSELLHHIHICLLRRPRRALFLYTDGGIMLCGSQRIGSIEHATPALTLEVAEENAFGSV